MRHGDAFAGIGGFALAARRAGMRTVWACEIEPSVRAVHVARCGCERFDPDIRESRNLPAIDVLTGGFPCQDLSVAGKRAGLAGGRSGLFFELVRLLEESRPEWFVFENVPGLLSSHGGRDMAVVLSSLVECGYGVAFRVLNAQFFGVAQRRRRVFIVGHSSGDERRAAAVLFEPPGVYRDSQEGGEEREDVAGTLGGGSGKRGWCNDLDRSGAFIAHTLRAEGFDASEDGTGRWTPLVAPLRCGGMADAKRPAGAGSDNVPLTVAFNWQASGADWMAPRAGYTDALHVGQTPAVAFQTSQSGTRVDSVHATLDSHNGARRRNGVICPPTDPARVRATPGLPRSLDVCPVCEEGPDSARYRGLGNAVAVPVVEWIMRRIVANTEER